ncbi:MAG: PAS domain S-box protein [Methanoregula sp.]|jgi:PAS domain S-box-containing protein|nr:PAS domain S-box protein [Methanoregula sp.]
MDLMIIQNSVTSFMIICVIIVFAFVFMRSRFFNEVFEHHPAWSTQVLLIIFFGILSIFGTLTRISIYGAVVNVRDLGPMAAGLICGPVIGIGSGIIGGLFRFAQGGPYMWTGLSAPILSGILGGILYLANKRQFVPTWVAVLYIGLSETLISCYTLILVTRPDQFITVVTDVAIPMVTFNVIGMFIFASVVHFTLKERQTQKEMQLLELELESKRNLSTIIDTIGYPVYVLDRDHRFVLVNDRLCQFVGRRREEILGVTAWDLFGKEQAAAHWDMTEDVFRTKTTRENETTQVMLDGQQRTLISTSTLYTDTTGHAFMVGIIQDITERKKMQVALAENEAWYRSLFEHTGAATIIINDDGKIDQANSEFIQLTGISRREIEGKVSWTRFAHPDELDMVKQYHHKRRVDPTSVPTTYTVRLIDSQGITRTMHAVVAMIPGTMKSIASYVDISEQKRSEEALTQVNRKLNLLSSITRHDIINQLMVLKGYLVLLRQKTENPTLLDYIGRSEKAAGSIEHQITFTRDYQDLGVKAPVWQNVKKSIINAKGALPMGSVTVDVDRSDLEILADPLFEKVFYNLIENSLRYGGEGLRTIRVRSQETDNRLILIYEDDGIGIADGDRPHLFERGFGKHSGFGLFLSREMLAITGIPIEENGTFGSGARFTLRVPFGMYRFGNDDGSRT